MPWSVRDVDKHRKGLSDTQKSKWCKVANGVLKTCMAEGGKGCEGRAIRIANAMFEKTKMSRRMIK